MAERIVLTTAEVTPQITTTDYRVVGIHLDREPQARILVNFRGTNGETREWKVDDPVRASNLLKALNTANLQLKSLERRCLELAMGDGVFAGAIAGTPDV